MHADESKRMATHVNRGLAWIGVASSLVGVLDIIAILVILNTWVDTEQFGIARECIWILPILDYATELGLSTSVIQRDDHTDTKISTVFWINVAIAALLFGLIVIFAPLLANGVYGHPIVGWMLIAYSVKLLWQNVYLIPIAMMKRELRFKELSVIRIIANLAEFAGKIGFAAAGFGIWCFILGPLARVLVTGIGAQLRYPWRPKLVCKLSEAKEYVSFGIKTSSSAVLYQVYTNVDYPIVGAFFGPYWLGVYSLAYEVVLEPVRIISNIIVDIAFPAFAKLRHSRDRLINQFVSFTKLNLITVMSYSAVVMIAAPDVIELLFPTYADAVPAVRILCLVGLLRALSYVIPPLLDGMGRPDRSFNYTAVATIVLPASYIVGSLLLRDHVGFLAVPIAWAVGYPIAFGVLVYFAVYTLEWSALAYLRQVLGVIFCLLVAAAVAAGVHFLLESQTAALRLLVTSGVYLAVMGVLLAYTQGISINSVRRSLAASDPEPLPDAPISE